MEICVAPISGGRFVNQLASFYNLVEYKYKPDVYLGASGGAASINIYITSGGTKNGIERNTKTVSSSLFVTKWVPHVDSIVPSTIVGVFQGSLFKHSTYLKELFYSLMTPGILRENEVWILAYNINMGCGELFCSTNQENAKLIGNPIDNRLTRISNLNYLDGDINTYCESCTASASIPGIVPPKKIKDSLYCDGGVLYASPFIPLRDQIVEYIKEENINGLHITYINGSNVDEKTYISCFDMKTILETGIETISTIVRSNIIQDRMSCYDLIKSMSGKIPTYEEFTLEEFFEKKKLFKYSLLETYPNIDECVKITSFSGEESWNLVLKQIPKIRYRCWYINF